jgi:plastocyanin
LLNVCPICRNVNQDDATMCRYCGTTLTPPSPEPVAQARRRRRWPWAVGSLALLLVVGLGGLGLLLGGGGAAAAPAAPVVVGTDTATALQFEPRSVTAPANSQINLTFRNLATLPHNLTFQSGPIDARTQEQLPAGQEETLSFTTPAPGTYPFVCTIHPGMEGQLVVQ